MHKNQVNILKVLGPGILFACVTIGGANFIQATHAGAEYGLKLIPLILLIYVLKYPFFEFAQRYMLATEETLLEGYLKVGRWALILYVALVTLTGLPTIAALSLIDSNITAYFLRTTISPLVLSIALLSLCTIILFVGKYPWLDRTVKLIMFTLISCALITFFIALPEGLKVIQSPSKTQIPLWTELTFLIALMGWMPAPIDISVWTTLWTKAKKKETGYNPSWKEGLLDFNLGYFISCLLVVIFVALGAFVMFSSCQSFSKSGVAFIEQLVTLFTAHIGKWGEPFIAIIIFSVLYSATLTCLDAYPRAVSQALALALPKTQPHTELIYWLSIILLFFTSIILSGYYLKSMKELIDIATILAFLTAPIFGLLNYRVVTHSSMRDKQPPRSLLILSRVGLIFLVSLSILFTVQHIIQRF